MYCKICINYTYIYDIFFACKKGVVENVGQHKQVERWTDYDQINGGWGLRLPIYGTI